MPLDVLKRDMHKRVFAPTDFDHLIALHVKKCLDLFPALFLWVQNVALYMHRGSLFFEHLTLRKIFKRLHIVIYFQNLDFLNIILATIPRVD